MTTYPDDTPPVPPVAIDFDGAAARVGTLFARPENDPALAKLLAEDAPSDPISKVERASQPEIEFEACKRAAAGNVYPNREAWLLALLAELRPAFKRQGAPIPEKVRIGVGFPSIRGIAANNQRIGECWSSERSGDDHHEIILSPVLADPMRVAGVLTHELVHAAGGVECGHKGAFRALAMALGLEGKMTATVEGDAFKAMAAPILDALGPYPHAELHAMTNGRKKQVARLVKCECDACGYVARVARQRLDEQGAPHCPAHGEMTIAQ